MSGQLSTIPAPPLRWPDGKTCAIWVAPNLESYEIDPVAVAIVMSCEFLPLAPPDTPFRAPGHMQTAFPDYRHSTARDYGSRLGVPRLPAALAAAGARASFAMNAR